MVLETKSPRLFSSENAGATIQGTQIQGYEGLMEGAKVAVLCGGVGSERQISLESGKCVHQALVEAGLESVLCDITPERIDILEDSSIDCFFPALHGQFGEDGTLQKIMEEKGLTFAGSGSEACRIAFDKMESKKYFIEAGLEVAKAILYTPQTTKADLEKLSGGDRFVVKPLRQGSSVGVVIVEGVDSAIEAAKRCFEEFSDCIVEEFIAGRELTATVLCGRVLPIIEIRPVEKFYNYQAKYQDEKTQFLFDTVEDRNIIGQIEQKTLKSFALVGLKDFARIDLILTETGKIYALEYNAIPGLTSHSLLPMSAAKAHVSMSGLCRMIAVSAIESRKIKLKGKI